MPRKKFAFDCDGPIFEDGTPNFFRFAIEEKKLPWDHELYALTGLWDKAGPGLTHADRDRLYAEYWKTSYRQPDIITSGAQEAHQRLLATERFLVTTRMNGMAVHTQMLIEQHLGSFTAYHFGVAGKDKVVSALGADLFVEDNIHEARLAASAGVETILFPVRDFPRPVRELRLTSLDADWGNHCGISDKNWQRVCRQAWREIVQIIIG